jgi:hypothetical protein
MAGRVVHRASILQAFHSGISETQRRANIEAHANKTDYNPAVKVTNTPEVTTSTATVTTGVKISAKQEKFILSLINSRDTSKLTILGNQTIEPSQLKFMSMSAGRALIEKLLNCPQKHSVRMPTEAQFNLMTRKHIEAGSPISETDIKDITFAQVNEFLAHMDTIIQANNSTKIEKSSITPGAYWYNGKIARVQKSQQSGKLYAKLQTTGDCFEYVPGLIYKLDPKDMLSISDMQKFAQAYGQCGDCGKKLTNKISIARGIGPVCSGKGYSEI